MHFKYRLFVDKASTHLAYVKISGQISSKKLRVYLPVWSPGSYLVRDYSRNVANFQACDELGNQAYWEKVSKNTWEVSFSHPEFSIVGEKFEISYQVYCKELTVRTSFIDESHAFIQGPSVFMAVAGMEERPIHLNIAFTPPWSKIATSLKDISEKREEYHYEARNYDEFVDSPIELGCHESDGFRVLGVDHHLAFYGRIFVDYKKLKSDMKKVAEMTASIFGEVPCDSYHFITHFVPGEFGGLEHLNSTVLLYCPLEMKDRKGYLDFMSLVAHEYFHTWNVKRIRPKELGPFDYNQENYTRMLWLAEGLTVFMDELLVHQAGLSSVEEYLEGIQKMLNRYYQTPGRKFHSLEDSSFDSWIKLYRPDENSSNSTISYYLKGAIVFFLLNAAYYRDGFSFHHFLKGLWSRFKKDAEVGMDKAEVLQLIKDTSSEHISEYFKGLIELTDEIDLEGKFKEVGLEIEFEKSEPSLGFSGEYKNGGVFVKSVSIDGGAYKSGLNAGDEILAFDQMRVTEKNFDKMVKIYKEQSKFVVLVSRHDEVVELTLLPEASLPVISKIRVGNKEKVAELLSNVLAKRSGK